jgi:RNA polymerase sigma-70 factor (ECF subfamily)
MKEDDILLIKECQAGQVSAFDRLVEIYRKQIYHLAYCITGNHEDADDISQETFVRAYRAICDFKGKARFSTWLRRITINLSINHLKSESLRKNVVNDGGKLNGGNFSGIPARTDNPLENVEAEELAQQIKVAMDSLPVVEKVVFVLRVHQGLSYKEIAQSLGCPVGTVMSRLNRARRRLRNRLKNYVV